MQMAAIVAHLDMMYSLVVYARTTQDCCANQVFVVSSLIKGCPEINANGPFALTQARHPLLEKISGSPVIPNNIYASELENFHIFTGPNMSGRYESLYMHHFLSPSS